MKKRGPKVQDEYKGNVRRFCVSLDEETAKKLQKIGNGNISLGVRIICKKILTE